MTIEIRNLAGIPFGTLTEAFNDAFSDYPIPATYTVEYLTNLVRRRGFRPDLALGAFDTAVAGGRLTGFVFNCLGDGDAYNSGTGAVISHRRQGIARSLMERSIATLPAKRYWLEVIDTNTRAADLYRDLGFSEMRGLQCWTFPLPAERARITEIANADLDELASWGEMRLSWQNSVASIRRATEPHFVLGNEDGAIVVFPSNGDVPLLAVKPKARRRGLGRTLLRAAAARCAKPLRIPNIEDTNAGIAAFLEAVGATRTVRQLEMMREL
jgi:ribosomal protein S18 acetylase RimI-like enzyme